MIKPGVIQTSDERYKPTPAGFTARLPKSAPTEPTAPPVPILRAVPERLEREYNRASSLYVCPKIFLTGNSKSKRKYLFMIYALLK